MGGQFCGRRTISASGLCPWGTESASGLCPGGQDLRGDKICSDTGVKINAQLCHCHLSFVAVIYLVGSLKLIFMSRPTCMCVTFWKRCNVL